MIYISVVNTINRNLFLVERCLNALLNQKVKPKKVILIDQNDFKLDLSDKILSNPLFELQKVNYKSVSSARNSIKIPEDVDYIFFCDDDGYPCQNYSDILQMLINNNPNIEIFAGSIIREDTGTYYSLRHKKGGSLSKFRNTKNLMGSNFVIKTSTFEKLGRFDENFGVGSYWGSSEETDLCWNAFFNKIPMEFFPELIVYHRPPFNESIKIGYIKSFKYGMGKGALVYKWMIRKRKLIVLYEFFEMFLVPIVNSFLAIIKLQQSLILTNMAALAGRLFGFIKASFVKNKDFI